MTMDEEMGLSLGDMLKAVKRRWYLLIIIPIIVAIAGYYYVTNHTYDVYTAQVKLNQYLLYLKKGEEFKPEKYLDALSERGEEKSVKYGIPQKILCDITSNVNTDVPGIYRVKYTLTQNFNLTSFSGQAVLVVIVQE